MGVDVRLDGVDRTYRTDSSAPITALRNVSLEVEAGAVVAVTGPSGSGKSTLLHVIGAMDRPDAGRVWVGNREITSLSRKEQAEYRRTIGFVFQRFHLLPALTALDNVVAPVIPYRTDFDKHGRARDRGLSLVGPAGGSTMATRTRKASGEIELVVEQGHCGDGCGAEVAKGRSFKQGHDAKLKSILGRAHKAGQSVAITSDGTRTSSTAEALLVARGWPVSAGPAPKATAAKPATASRATKYRTKAPARA